MSAFDFASQASTVLVWAAGAVAALVLVVALTAWRRGRLGTVALALAVAAVVAAGLFVARSQFRVEGGSAERDRIARRADELAARALAPNSPLACLDAPTGPAVEAACEALLFGRPETVAAAVSYVAAKLALLSDAAAVSGSEAAQGEGLAAMRRGLAADRFGLVAHVLASNPLCDADRCAAFSLVGDADRVKTNMREGTFDRLVARHATSWPAGERGAAVTEAAPSKNAAPTGAPPTVAKPLGPGQDFPSAASIPPVSIMTNEPPRSAEPGEAGEKPAAEPRKPPTPAPSSTSALSSPSGPPAFPPLPRAAPRNAPGSGAPARAATPAPPQTTAAPSEPAGSAAQD